MRIEEIQTACQAAIDKACGALPCSPEEIDILGLSNLVTEIKVTLKVRGRYLRAGYSPTNKTVRITEMREVEI